MIKFYQHHKQKYISKQKTLNHQEIYMNTNASRLQE